MRRATRGSGFTRLSRWERHQADLFFADLMGLPAAARRSRIAEVESEASAESGPLVEGPLTDSEWRTVVTILTRGEAQVGAPLTDNADTNALLVAARVFCDRNALRLEREDPLLCVTNDVTMADPRVRALVPHVVARGPIVDWTRQPRDSRVLHVMRLLAGPYGYPVNAAAGIVGNLMAESAVLPQRVEGSAEATPMRARDFAGRSVDFTAEDIINRSAARRTGPVKPGIGLAQWTSPPSRRAGLFAHSFRGVPLGPRVLFDMDAQVDYLVTELRSASFAAAQRVLTNASVSVDDASDAIVLHFERPKAVIDGGAGRAAVLTERRTRARSAAATYNAAANRPHP